MNSAYPLEAALEVRRRARECAEAEVVRLKGAVVAAELEIARTQEMIQSLVVRLEQLNGFEVGDSLCGADFVARCAYIRAEAVEMETFVDSLRTWSRRRVQAFARYERARGEVLMLLRAEQALELDRSSWLQAERRRQEGRIELEEDESAMMVWRRRTLNGR